MTVHSRSRVPGRAYRAHAASDAMASTSAHPARPFAPQLQTLELLLIAGLSGVFIVNAIVAFLEPSDFTGLVARSLLGRVIPTMGGRWIAWVIAVHDLTVGISLVATLWLPRARPFVLAWAGAWLLAVTLVKLTALDAFGG